MRILPFILILVLSTCNLYSQSPHGDKFKLDCSNCHEATSWKVIPKNIKFDHNETSFKLVGQHAEVSCKSCHTTLVFSDAQSTCNSCHKDIHRGSVGLDCASCHSPESWLVTDVYEIHQRSRFPLTGAHLNTDCASCHKEYSQLYFPPQDISCFACHSKDYYAATSPNHVSAGFSTECSDCHGVNSTAWAAQNFDHSFFPLTGGHNIQNCFSCHKEGTNFKGLSTDCYSCHKATFEATTNPNHIKNNFPTDCLECHNTNSFVPSTFDHNKTNFPLTGRHATLSCSSCHSSGFANTPSDCYSCHQSDYTRVKDPDHVAGNFSTDCTQCHSTNGWGDATFDHSITAFPLTGAHITVSCSGCHTSGFTGTSTDCYTCHNSNYSSAQNPDHKAAGLPTDCKGCHTTNAWVPSDFNHATTGFELTGQHLALECSGCHKGTVTGSSAECISCHRDKYNSAENHLTQNYPTDCTMCHNTTSWDQSIFNHSVTAFPLTGAHVTVQCASCHTNGFAGTPADCYSCHQSNYQNTTDPNHVKENFPTDCTQCHSTNNWTESTFDHARTAFPLTGAHITVSCANCHTAGYTGTSTDCYSCHSSNYDNSQNPSHKASGLPTDCSSCHSTTAWVPSTFNHAATGFELTGSHLSLDCSGCHKGTVTGLSPDCVSCHLSNYNSAENHVAQNYPQNCTMCHNTTAWDQSIFDHATTAFPLTGAHVSVQCSSCHTSGFTGTPTDCYSCHQQNYQNTTDPNHVTGNFPTDCTQCHSTTNWTEATFDHSSTAFPLTGAHINVQCASCHASGFTGTPTDCYSCHKATYDNAQNPNHGAAGISTDCKSCHNTNAWIPSAFNHTTTGFELTGSHLSIDCSACHKGTTSGLTPDCASCHKDKYTTAPDHVSQNYPTDCTLCHNTTAWSPSSFDHNTTAFPLTGAHISVQCSSCHQSGFAGTSTQCYSCHQLNYESTTNPSHTAIALSTDCQTCHTTDPGWKPATFPVHSNFFAIVGAHTAIANDCVKCHNGNYTSTPNTCVGCHQSDYDATTNPPHASNGFPTDCISCHTQNGWTPATFDHDSKYFPIYSGRHSSVWSSCATCHINSSNYADFSCIDCHTHSRTNTDGHHSDVGGYVYQSSACYNCHPTGTAGGD